MTARRRRPSRPLRSTDRPAMKTLLALLALCGVLLLPAAAQAPDRVPKPEPGPFALVNARLVTVSDGVVEGGTLVIRDGRIEALGADVAPPADARVIDAAGLSVYPGLIDGGTRLGLVEVGSLSETRDYDEIGAVTPQMQALTAVNPNAVAIPVTRVNGVTTVLAVPSGSLMPGTAALINLVGYTPEQMDAGARAVVVEFPRQGKRGWWDRRSEKEIEKAYEEALGQLTEAWTQARLYARIDSAYAADPDPERRPEYAPQMAALLPVVRGETPLLIEADRARDIEAALDWAEAQALPRVILSGAAEGWRVADRIAEAGVPVLVGPVLSVPTRDSDRYDKPYENAGLLQRAGVKVALRTGEAENVRNLPYHAGFAAAYGLGREAALRAVTLAPAEIFGVADRLGSLEVGKQATLFIADGDPFETQTKVVHVFIDGYRVPMTSRQTRLYDEFLDRRPGVE